MPAKKSGQKKSAPKASRKGQATRKAGSKQTVRTGAARKSGNRKAAKKRATGILDKAKEALKAVLSSAAAGAAEGAVVGAADAGEKVAGSAKPQTTKTSDQKSSRAVKK